MAQQEWLSAFAQIGGIGLVLWWLTQKLIPKMIEQFDKSLLAFQVEMEKERMLHREINDKLNARNEYAINELLTHLSTKH